MKFKLMQLAIMKQFSKIHLDNYSWEGKDLENDKFAVGNYIQFKGTDKRAK